MLSEMKRATSLRNRFFYFGFCQNKKRISSFQFLNFQTPKYDENQNFGFEGKNEAAVGEDKDFDDVGTDDEKPMVGRMRKFYQRPRDDSADSLANNLEDLSIGRPSRPHVGKKSAVTKAIRRPQLPEREKVLKSYLYFS